MAQDKFAGIAMTPTSPATSIAAVVPNDAADLAKVTIALNVATPGTVRVTMADGSIGDIHIVQGILFPLRVARIWDTGTTATGIVALH